VKFILEAEYCATMVTNNTTRSRPYCLTADYLVISDCC